jgi:hypothetical protein
MKFIFLEICSTLIAIDREMELCRLTGALGRLMFIPIKMRERKIGIHPLDNCKSSELG